MGTPNTYRRHGDDRIESFDAGGNTKYYLNFMNYIASIEALVGPMTLTSISPSTGVHGAADMLVTLTGTGFTPASQIWWNGVLDSGIYVSPTQMTTVVKLSLATVGSTNTLQVKQRDTFSAPKTFTIT